MATCTCGDCQACRHRTHVEKYNAANVEKIRARRRKHYLENRERMLVAAKKWRTENPEQHRINARNWKQANRERHNASNRAWNERNKDKRVLAKMRRRTTLGACSKEQLEARVEMYGRRCYLCAVPYEAIDHVIPISRGGTNWPSNLRPICTTCNSTKHTKLLRELVAA